MQTVLNSNIILDFANSTQRIILLTIYSQNNIENKLYKIIVIIK